MIDEKRLAEIEARCNAATRGPWIVAETGKRAYRGALFVDDPSLDMWEDHEPIFVAEEHVSAMGNPWTSPPRAERIEDARFIAHARDDVPELIAEVRRLQRYQVGSLWRARRRAMRDVWWEHDAQDVKWGEQNHSDLGFLAILTEEVGEAAKACCKGYMGDPGASEDEKAAQRAHVRTEVVQIAAVAVQWIEAIDRRNAGKGADDE